MKRYACWFLFIALFLGGFWLYIDFFRSIDSIRLEMREVAARFELYNKKKVKKTVRAIAGDKLLTDSVVDTPIPCEKAVASLSVRLQRECKNAIVKVLVDQAIFNWAEPYKVSDQQSVCGSGFFINEDGFFLTNYHVVGHAVRVQIQTPSLGQEKLDCNVVGVCPERDLALLKIDDEAKSRIKNKIGAISFLPLGDSDDLRRGVDVVAIGFPLGKDIIKGVTGVISGWEEISLGEKGGVLSCCETTAPINPGSSGGPVLNLDGEVIGISFAGMTKMQNVGYLLPINELKSAINKLYSVKILHKPYIGIMIQESNDSFDKYLGNPEKGGVYVRRVLKGSLADKAGLKVGDIIYRFNGFALDHHGDTIVPWREDFVHYQNITQRLEIGDDIIIEVYRQGVSKTFSFKLAYDKSIKVKSYYPGYEDIDYEVFGGLVVMNFSLNHVADLCACNPALLKYVYPENWDKQVLVVTHVLGTSEAHRSMVNKGCIISKVGDTSVTTLEEFRSEVSKMMEQPFVTLTAEDQSLVVFDTKRMLADELRLARLFKYPEVHSVSLIKALGMEA